MKYFCLTLALSLGGVVHASSILQYPDTSCSEASKLVCRDLFLPIKAAANNTVYPPYPNSTTPGVLYQYLQSFNTSTLSVAPVSGTFNISATYCEPSVKVEGREGTIQFLLHGVSATKVSSDII